MNKRILNISLFLMLASTGNVLAQQGIGTNTPHRSAALQIDSQNKGILIPRMNLGYDATDNIITAPSITSPLNQSVKGLLVYNQTGIANVPEGFYYFDGSEWNPISKSYLQSNDHTTITGNGTSSDPYKVNIKPATDHTNQKVLATNTNGQVVWVEQGANTDTQTKLTQGTNVSITPNPSNFSVGGVNNYTIDVPTATDNTLGVVKPGSGLAIGNDGTLNVTVVDTNTDDQKLTFNSSTNELTIEDGNTVDLSSIDTNTTYSAGNGITLTDTVFSVPLSVTGEGNVISGVTANSTGLEFSTVQIATTDTTYTDGGGISLNGTEFSVPVTTSSSSVANGNVITNVVQTADGIEITKSQIATTDTKTKVAVTGPITLAQNPAAFTENGENTYTLGLNVGTGLQINNGVLNATVVDTDTKTQVTGNGAISVTPNSLANNTTNTYTVSVGTANASNLGVVKGGGNVNIAADGTLSVNTSNTGIGKTLTGSGITVTAGSTVGTSTSLANSVLADVTLGIADNAVTSIKINNNAVTTAKIADDAVTAAKINADVAGAGLIQNTNGALDVKAVNGLRVDTTTGANGDAVKLGGALTENTTITTNTNDFTIATTQSGTTGKLKITGLQTVAQATSDKIMVVSSDGTLKQAKAVMPKFFYAPAVYIPTHNTTTGDLLEETQTVELYNEYKKQFEWQGATNNLTYATDGPNAYGQARSSNSVNLPVLANTDLEYFVTYYDATVFSNVQISSTGTMTYTVNYNVSITPRTFINVVFKVKD